MTESKRIVNGKLTISELIEELKAELKVSSLLLYVNAAFAPCATDTLDELAKNFGSQTLNFNYSITPAWG